MGAIFYCGNKKFALANKKCYFGNSLWHLDYAMFYCDDKKLPFGDKKFHFGNEMFHFDGHLGIKISHLARKKHQKETNWQCLISAIDS